MWGSHILPPTTFVPGEGPDELREADPSLLWWLLSGPVASGEHWLGGWGRSLTTLMFTAGKLWAIHY